MRKIIAFLLLALVAAAPLVAQTSFVNGPSHEGLELTCDLPEAEHIKNIGSKIDGAGMCVMSSIEMAARFDGLEQLRGLRDWCAQFPGGGYPAKVDEQLAKFFKEKGIAPVPYMQYEGNSPEKILDLIDRTGRMACITYGYSPRYGQRISHMTCCAMFRGKWGVVLDNNFIGDSQYEWVERAELVRRIKIGSAWVFVWLSPPSPPSPKNRG